MVCGVLPGAGARHGQLLHAAYSSAEPTISRPAAPSAAQASGAPAPLRPRSSGTATASTPASVSAAASTMKVTIRARRPRRPAPSATSAARVRTMRHDTSTPIASSTSGALHSHALRQMKRGRNRMKSP